jgi:hypothetical protein
MNKLTLSFKILAAIVAVTILQASAGTAGATSPPVLDPSSAYVPCTGTSGTCTVRVKITGTPCLCYYFYPSTLCKEAVSGVTVRFPATRSGTTLVARTGTVGHFNYAWGTYTCY